MKIWPWVHYKTTAWRRQTVPSAPLCWTSSPSSLWFAPISCGALNNDNADVENTEDDGEKEDQIEDGSGDGGKWGVLYILYIIFIHSVLHSSYFKAPPNVPLSHLCSVFFEGRPSLCFRLFFVSALALGSLWALLVLGWMAKFKFIRGASGLGNQTIKNGPGWPEVIVLSLGACRPLFKSEIS